MVKWAEFGVPSIHAMKTVQPDIIDLKHVGFWTLRDGRRRAFTAQTFRAPAYRFAWHSHAEWEIVFSRSGSGKRHVGNSVEKFGPGDLVMLPGKIPHTWDSSKNQAGPVCCTVIHFLPEAWGDAFWSLPEIESFQALCQRASRGLHFTGEGVEEVGQRMEALAMNDAASIESFLELWKIFGLLTKLEACSLNATEERGRRRQQRAGLEDLLQWIESHSGDPITQNQAAARMRMSPASFSRWFKSNMGCVFNRYLNHIRITKVCAEIARRDLSITEAAYHAGYQNLSNFNRRFREVTGVTPRAFRSQLAMKPMKVVA